MLWFAVVAMQFTTNFRLEEFQYSKIAADNGIDNSPDDEKISNLVYLAENCLQPIRNHFGRAVTVISGFRSKKLNELMNGKSYSLHLTGEAADFVIEGVSTRTILKWIAESGLNFDQAIDERDGERTWIHLSCRKSNNRHEAIFFDKCSE